MTGVETLATGAAVTAAVGGLARTLPNHRIRFAGLALLLVGWVALAAAIAPASVRDRWPLLLVGAVAALAVGWQVARFLVGRERWLLTAGALVLTLRLPVPVGGDHVMLLAPLYVVIGLGTLVLARGELRALSSSDSTRGIESVDIAGRLIDLGAATLLALGTLSIIWSIDRMASAEDLAFFYVPFLLLYALVRAWVRTSRDLRGSAIALVTAATVAAVVGLVQAATNDVWWNPKVINGNRFRADFRTNSLFWDPNIYGRALVVSALVLVAWLLMSQRPRRGQRAGAVGLLALFGAAMWHTYSQSSWLALAAALTALALLCLPSRPRRITAVTVVVLLAIGAVPAFHALRGADVTGRGSVAHLGLQLAKEHPVQGWGIGTFSQAATQQALDDGDAHPPLVASHATPITIVAELGLLGAAAYALLLGGAAAAMLRRWTRTGTARPGVAIIWATGVVVAVTVHSLLYAGFFEDASVWTALAVLAGVSGGDLDASRSSGVTGDEHRPAPVAIGQTIL